ncbi:MAG: dephospho-CoA kinase [Schleiferiaceae bacterium]|nr:dephospho-CoA kinase [Schleiferiaceae bacterium]
MTHVVCITGGIGSGKSTVCKYIEQRGYPVYYSDTRAKELMEHDHQIREQIIAVFGPTIYTDSEELNRSELARHIFNDPDLKQSLESIVHPRVHEDFVQWSKDQTSQLLFKESPLALEIGDQSCQTIVVVHAEVELRISRVLIRNSDWIREDVEARMRNQISDEQRLQLAHQVLDNSSTPEALQEKLDQLLTKWS